MPGEERRERPVEVVSRLYTEGWGQGDFDLVFELLDADIVWTAIEGAPDAGTYRGLEGVRAYMQDWLDEFGLQRRRRQDRGVGRGGRVPRLPATRGRHG